MPSGLPVAFVLTVRDGRLQDVRTIPAILALARRHLPMLRAKRTVEAVVEHGRAYVELPIVESADAVVQELALHGIAAQPSEVPAVDVRALRERMGQTQEQFALRYKLDVSAVRNWEQGRTVPDAAARNYLRVIEVDPQAVERMVWSASHSSPHPGHGEHTAERGCC